MAWLRLCSRMVLIEDWDQLGLAGCTAGLRVHDGSLGSQRWLAGSFLVLDVRPEGLVGLHRYRLRELGVALDRGECVLTPELRIAVAMQEAQQELCLRILRPGRGVDNGSIEAAAYVPREHS